MFVVLVLLFMGHVFLIIVEFGVPSILVVFICNCC